MSATRKKHLGILLMAGAMLAAPSIDIIAKVLVTRYGMIQIVLSRFVIHAIFFSVLLLVYRRRVAWPSFSHAIAGVLVALSWLLLVASFSVMQVATALTIFFAEPLLLVLLSRLLLQEPLSVRNIAAVVVGLIGVVIVIRPNFTSFGLAILMPLAAAACFAMYMVLNKRIGDSQGYLQFQFWIGCFASLFFTAIILAGPIVEIAELQPRTVGDTTDVLLFLAIGLIGGGVHLCIATALQFTPASVLAPFQYLEIIGATLLGLWVFGSWPDYPTLIGAVIIISAGVFSFHNERRRGIAVP